MSINVVPATIMRQASRGRSSSPPVATILQLTPRGQQAVASRPTASALQPDVRIRLRYVHPQADGVCVIVADANARFELARVGTAWETTMSVKGYSFWYRYVVRIWQGDHYVDLPETKEFRLDPAMADPYAGPICVTVDDAPKENPRISIMPSGTNGFRTSGWRVLSARSSARDSLGRSSSAVHPQQYDSASTYCGTPQQPRLPGDLADRDTDIVDISDLRQRLVALRHSWGDLRRVCTNQQETQRALSEVLNEKLRSVMCMSAEQKTLLQKQVGRMESELGKERAHATKLRGELLDLKHRTQVLFRILPGVEQFLERGEGSVTCTAGATTRTFNGIFVDGDNCALRAAFRPLVSDLSRPAVVFAYGGRRTGKSESLWGSGGLAECLGAILLNHHPWLLLSAVQVANDKVIDLLDNRPIDENATPLEFTVKNVVDVARVVGEALRDSSWFVNEPEDALEPQIPRHFIVGLRAVRASQNSEPGKTLASAHLVELASSDIRKAARDLMAVGAVGSALLRNTRPLPVRGSQLTQRLERWLVNGRAIFVPHLRDEGALAQEAMRSLRYGAKLLDLDKGGFKGLDGDDIQFKLREAELTVKDKEKRILELRTAVRNRYENVQKLEAQLLKAGRVLSPSPDREDDDSIFRRGKSLGNLPRSDSTDYYLRKMQKSPRAVGRAYSQDSIAIASARSARRWKERSGTRGSVASARPSRLKGTEDGTPRNLLSDFSASPQRATPVVSGSQSARYRPWS
mmetsp:Transcript_17966/g.41490  ORF Transcript_17966/g.41490 Transcript_17966/m.41490 type:complete len:748 (+) Transcript_17966:131-2374(+)